mmetsp:Transcript_22574/g.48941  ORF Transcript_22574/g.48941 Transcript_22574/m.48941 type:complete len:111 (+) Transcript_22574:560-892(+)
MGHDNKHPQVEDGGHFQGWRDWTNDTTIFLLMMMQQPFFANPRGCLMQARGGALAPQNIGLRQALGGETCISKGGNKLGEHYNPGWGGIFLGREYRVQGCDDPPRTGSWD